MNKYVTYLYYKIISNKNDYRIVDLINDINNNKIIEKEKFLLRNDGKKMDEYNEWCDTEAKADTIIGISLLVFGISSTFMDSVVWLGNIISIISLIVFITGYIIRVINNKKHLGHFFVR